MRSTIIRVVEPISSSLLSETCASHAVFTSSCPPRHPGVRHQSYDDHPRRDVRLPELRRHRAVRQAGPPSSAPGPDDVGDGAGPPGRGAPRRGRHPARRPGGLGPHPRPAGPPARARRGPRRSPVAARVGDLARPADRAPGRGVGRVRGRQRSGMAGMAGAAHRRDDLLPRGGADAAAPVVVDPRHRIGPRGVRGHRAHGAAPVGGRRAHRLLPRRPGRRAGAVQRPGRDGPRDRDLRQPERARRGPRPAPARRLGRGDEPPDVVGPSRGVRGRGARLRRC